MYVTLISEEADENHCGRGPIMADREIGLRTKDLYLAMSARATCKKGRNMRGTY